MLSIFGKTATNALLAASKLFNQVKSSLNFVCTWYFRTPYNPSLSNSSPNSTFAMQFLPAFSEACESMAPEMVTAVNGTDLYAFQCSKPWTHLLTYNCAYVPDPTQTSNIIALYECANSGHYQRDEIVSILKNWLDVTCTPYDFTWQDTLAIVSPLAAAILLLCYCNRRCLRSVDWCLCITSCIKDYIKDCFAACSAERLAQTELSSSTRIFGGIPYWCNVSMLLGGIGVGIGGLIINLQGQAQAVRWTSGMYDAKEWIGFAMGMVGIGMSCVGGRSIYSRAKVQLVEAMRVRINTPVPRLVEIKEETISAHTKAEPESTSIQTETAEFPYQVIPDGLDKRPSNHL